MQATLSLNDLHARYTNGLIERNIFEGMIFTAIRDSFPSIPGIGREDAEDCVSWLYPRITRAVDRYRDDGSCFEAYIQAMVRLAAREFRAMRTHGYNTETSAWISLLPDMRFRAEAAEPPAIYGESLPARPAAVPRNHRQLLMLVLKCCRHVSDDFIRSASLRIGLDEAILRGMVAALNKDVMKYEARRESLREIANRHLCRRMYYENLMRVTRENPTRYQKAKIGSEIYRRKLDRTRERLAGVRLHPSNASIAEVLGISKGAVDSAIHRLRVQAREAERSAGMAPITPPKNVPRPRGRTPRSEGCA